ncbi:NAD-dependent epimerase/dehydratase family protein [Cellvibrio fontiphilus]|uniref:NAD-dependent epimerase/dehydratase family protein n=1 Tax=Cellvibrio fontiphilus TaxID=1815559 RepID=A0ABV7FDZ4_9GAMM
MNLLITGANGYVGRYLCPLLIADGHHAITLTRKAWHQPPARNYLWEAGVMPALQGVDLVIHLAALAHQAGPESPETAALYHAVNVEQTRQLASAALAQGVKRFIYLSSIKVNGESTDCSPYRYDTQPQPEDSYGRSKWAAEQVLHELLDGSTTELVIIRPPLIWGGEMKGNLALLQRWVRWRLPLPFGGIHNRRDLVSIDNLCSLIRLVLDHPQAAGQTLLVSDGVTRNTADIVRLVSAAGAVSPLIIPCPAWLFRLFTYLPVVGARLKKLTGNLEVDITPTCERLGWRPLLLDRGAKS